MGTPLSRIELMGFETAQIPNHKDIHNQISMRSIGRSISSFFFLLGPKVRLEFRDAIFTQNVYITPRILHHNFVLIIAHIALHSSSHPQNIPNLSTSRICVVHTLHIIQPPPKGPSSVVPILHDSNVP